MVSVYYQNKVFVRGQQFNRMSAYRMPLEFVQESIERGFGASCHQIHHLTCNQFSFNYFFNTCSASYSTYAAVYAIQLIFKLKAILKDPTKQLPKLAMQYLRSTSLTAVQMMIMRRILCFLATIQNESRNLFVANLLSAIYLLIQSPSRQIEIALYQLTNTSNILYNMGKRRKWMQPFPMGENILFSLSIMVICYVFLDERSHLRKNYMKFIVQKLIGQV